MSHCPLCGTAERASVLAEAGWADPQVEARIQRSQPTWRRADGACPACLQRALLTLLLEKGEAVLGRVIQAVWPLDAEAAFGALPTPLRMRADPRYTGKGVTVAVVDAAFSPHADLAEPENRIRAWVDATREVPEVRTFDRDEVPSWPGSHEASDRQWHGLMTSCTVAGNGARSHGLYRGLASDADVVLIQVLGDDGRIGSARVLRALRWLADHHARFGIRVVNVSLGVAPSCKGAMEEIEGAVTALVAAGVAVVVAAGNDGVRRLVPPATAPDAVTVGGLDDRNTFDLADRTLWHSNYGDTGNGRHKPELVAPSIWVVAPILPGTPTAFEASELFARRAAGDVKAEPRIAEQRLVTPHYQHVEGTSFAAPIVSGVVACMLEAYPALTPTVLRTVLESACQHVPGASTAQQGAGAIDAGRAVAAALAVAHGVRLTTEWSPRVSAHGACVQYFDHRARAVRLLGSWDGWREGAQAARDPHGVWTVSVGPLAPGRYQYKLLVDDNRWMVDEANPVRESDGLGGWNSVLEISPRSQDS